MKLLHTSQVFHPRGKECWPPPNTYRESSVPCGDSKQTTLDGIQLTGQGKWGSMYEKLQLPPHRNTITPKWIFYVFFFFLNPTEMLIVSSLSSQITYTLVSTGLWNAHIIFEGHWPACRFGLSFCKNCKDSTNSVSCLHSNAVFNLSKIRWRLFCLP